MVRNSVVLIVVIVVSLFSFSCTNNNDNEQSELFNQLIKTEKGIIRGVSIDDKWVQVQKAENKRNLVSKSNAHLEYEFEINEEAFIVVAYHFDDKGCSEINIDTYFDAKEQTDEAITIYLEHFTAKYGKYLAEDDMYLWKNKDKTISVELDYLDKDDGELMLTVYATE